MSEEYRQLLAAAVDIIAEEWGHAGELESGAQLSETSVSDFLERSRAALAVDPPDGFDETMSWNGQAVARAINEQMSEAVEPIPIADRKPGPDDLKNGKAWYGQPQPFGDEDTWDWCYTKPMHGEGSSFTHWLPASAKYLPARVE